MSTTTPTTSSFKSWEEAVQWLREQPDQQELVQAAYYDDPLPAAANRFWTSDEWEALRQYLPTACGQALDVGAGRGIASYALAKEGFQVTALEPDVSALVGANAIRELAQICSLPITVTEEFSERLPFADNNFDLVYARAVLHHTRDLDAACREFFRVLRPGGRLVAVREHVISRNSDLPAFQQDHPLHNLYGGENAFMLNQYTDAIEKAGFQITTLLEPFDSPVNFAPYSLSRLQCEIASRIGAKMPVLGPLANVMLKWPAGWSLARYVLNKIDHRPGRLYSFIADRC